MSSDATSPPVCSGAQPPRSVFSLGLRVRAHLEVFATTTDATQVLVTVGTLLKTNAPLEVSRCVVLN